MKFDEIDNSNSRLDAYCPELRFDYSSHLRLSTVRSLTEEEVGDSPDKKLGLAGERETGSTGRR
jgi:hypothetical protein